MENVRKKNELFETIAWGLLFLWWGLALLIPNLPEGASVAGSGLILIGINLARFSKGLPSAGFSTVVGILALVGGGLEMARPILRLPFELPLFAILLIVLGFVLLTREISAMLRGRVGAAD